MFLVVHVTLNGYYIYYSHSLSLQPIGEESNARIVDLVGTPKGEATITTPF